MSNGVIQNIDNVKVSPNEYMIKYTFWRNLKKLLENDINLDSLYEMISQSISLEMYSSGKAYNFGAKVWYLYANKSRLVILQSIVNNNTRSPEYGGNKFEDNGWQPLTMDVDIYTTDVFSRIERAVYALIKEHQDKLHPHGELSKDNLVEKFAKADLTNLNPSRPRYMFPSKTVFLPVDSTDKVILNGSYRYYDCGLIEYDITYQFGFVRKTKYEGVMFDEIECNNVVFKNENNNSRYFYDQAAYSIFAPQNTSEQNFSIIDTTMQKNRNDFVNTYFAEIKFPVPFVDSKYIIFSGQSLAQENSGLNIVKPGKNQIVFCNKSRKSVTAMLITYPDGNWGNPGFNTSTGGLALNSFKCKIVGRAKVINE